MSLTPDIERVLIPMVRYCQSMAVTARARGWNERPWLDLIINLEAAPERIAALVEQREEAAGREADQRADTAFLVGCNHGRRAALNEAAEDIWSAPTVTAGCPVWPTEIQDWLRDRAGGES